METKAEGKPITKSKLDAILHPTQKKQRGSLYLVLSVQNGYNMYSYQKKEKCIKVSVTLTMMTPTNHMISDVSQTCNMTLPKGCGQKSI